MPDQIQAIESALSDRPHTVDMRLSIPFFGKGAYVVVIAGTERRTIRQRQANAPLVKNKENRAECEKSDRQWIDEECVDTIHDPVF